MPKSKLLPNQMVVESSNVIPTTKPAHWFLDWQFVTPVDFHTRGTNDTIDVRQESWATAIENGLQKTPRRSKSNGGFGNFLFLIVADLLLAPVILIREPNQQNVILVIHNPVRMTGRQRG